MSVAAVAPGESVAGGRWRVVVMRLIYGLLALWALLMSQGVLLLALGVAPDGGAVPTRLEFALATSTLWKLLTLGGAIVLAWTGGRSVLAAQGLLLGVVCWSAAEALAPADPTDPRPWWLLSLQTVVIWVGPWIALSPRRRELLRPRFRVRPTVLALAGTGAIACVGYAVALGGRAAAVAEAEALFASVALFITLGAFMVWAALVHELHPLPLWAAGAATAATAVAALVWPQALGSPGRLAAVAVLAWASAVVTAAYAGRRTRSTVS